MEPIWALGLMSGTSLDGVDAAWLLTDGQKVFEVGEGFMVPYPPQLRERLRTILGQKGETAECTAIERELTQYHGNVVKQALLKINNRYPIDIIGFHGHTIFHAPPITRQIGDGQLLANDVGIPVLYDFRTADVMHGGQGAPLASVFHQVMVTGKEPEVILNVGGVANMTWVHQGHPLIAFDTGPGGALLDDWILQHTGRTYDQEGQLSAQGVVDEALVESWMTHPYFKQDVPKSLDRDDFETVLNDLAGVSTTNGAATLAEFTARSIVQGLTQVPTKPKNIYVCGGGRHNKHLMQRLSALAQCSVESVEALDWDGDLVEAYLFAYLAARVKVGLPTSYPTTTGVSHPISGGKLATPLA